MTVVNDAITEIGDYRVYGSMDDMGSGTYNLPHHKSFSYESVYSSVSGVSNCYLFNDGLESYRFQARASNLYLDHTLTAIGFGGTEHVDWESLTGW